MTYIVNDKCIKCKLMDCVEVCPVKIPITKILLRLRQQKEDYKSKISSPLISKN